VSSGLEKTVNETVLGKWSREHGAFMVNFGGWSMPRHYGSKHQGKPSIWTDPIILEHDAVRRNVGVFPVDHMGRFDVEGPQALDFLQYVLTSNMDIEVGQARYGLMSDHMGYAKDDLYGYRLEDDKSGRRKFRLVVNAGNREKDWAWLHENKKYFPNVHIEDRSEELSMISLQGPKSILVLEKIVGGFEKLPDRKNTFKYVEILGKKVMVAFTGYTKEANGYELILPSDIAVPAMELFMSHGAVPAGLGARNSLRAEGSLILYGHELGFAPDGQEIPILANDVASIGISFSEAKGDYIGRNALDRQMSELELIRRGRYDLLPQDRKLKRIVKPILVENFDVNKGRSLREGYKVYFNGEEVGVVTTGLLAPYLKFSEEGIRGVPLEDFGIRSIGLALLDVRQDLRYNSKEPIRLQIMHKPLYSDEIKLLPELESILLEKHMIPLAPYSRAVVGFPYKRVIPVADDRPMKEKIVPYVRKNIDHARESHEYGLQMVPSVIDPTPLSKIIAALFPGEYGEHRNIFGPGTKDTEFYPHTDALLSAEEKVIGEIKKYTGRDQIEVRPISGQQAVSIAIQGMRNYRNRGYRRGTQPKRLRVIVNGLSYGGHLSAQTSGSLGPHAEMDTILERSAIEYFPIREKYPHMIDVEETIKLVERFKPDLLIFGGSAKIGPEPIEPITRAIHSIYGRDNPDRPVSMYDMAHVFGLLGPYFQNPFDEGIDVVTFSTHKTLQSHPRGGIIGNLVEGSIMEVLWEFIVNATFPGHQSSHHPATLVASYLDFVEMNEFRDIYQKTLIADTQAFARTLINLGFDGKDGRPNVERYSEFEDVRSHMALLDVGYGKGPDVSRMLEMNRIYANAQGLPRRGGFIDSAGIRTGFTYLVKVGAEPKHAEDIAGFFNDVICHGKNIEQEVMSYRKKNGLLGIRFCYSVEKAKALADEAYDTIMLPYKQ